MTIERQRHRSISAVILAGGTGARFWPLSRELTPKQLLSIFGEESLIVQAITRVQPFIAHQAGAIRIVTNERLLNTLQEHLQEQEAEWRDWVSFSVEPVARNTAPAIALAAAEAARDDPDAILLVLPSDHILQADDAWLATIREAIHLADDAFLVMIGLQPTRPETGYGYIVGGEVVPDYLDNVTAPRHVRRFIEKPPLVLAERLVAQTGVYWNAGIFCFRATRLLQAMRDAGRADIVDTCEWLVRQPKAQWTDEEAIRRFSALPSISIDHAVMEHATHLAVVPAHIHWDDVGSLLSLERLQSPDARGNIRIGRSVDLDSQDLTVYSTHRLIATLGLANCIVVDTNDATLICPKDRCQDIRWLTDTLKSSEAKELIEPCISYRSWGTWSTIVRQQGFEIRLLEIQPGGQSYLHLHRQRTETLVVLAGTLTLHLNQDQRTLLPAENCIVPPEFPHWFENTGSEIVRALEIILGDSISETDVIRLSNPE